MKLLLTRYDWENPCRGCGLPVVEEYVGEIDGEVMLWLGGGICGCAWDWPRPKPGYPAAGDAR